MMYMNNPLENKPLAAPGLISYRYPTSYRSFCMIGATDDADAMVQAGRSVYGVLSPDKLEKWNGTEYAKVSAENGR